MLEKEQSYVEMLRSELAKLGAGNSNSIASLQTDLTGAERRVRVLQERLNAVSNNDHVRSYFFYLTYIYILIREGIRFV